MVKKNKYDIKKSAERFFVTLVIFGATLEAMDYNWTVAIGGSIFMALWNAAKFYIKSKGYAWN